MCFDAKFVLKLKFLYYVVFVIITRPTEGKWPGLFNGTSAIAHPYMKHMAIITYKGYHCGGAIITPRAILTAASCVSYDGSQPPLQEDIDAARICVGTSLTSCQSRTAQVCSVENVYVHKKFVHLQYVYDIAILILRQDIVENGITVERIKLADQRTPVGTACALIGWGDIRCARIHRKYREEAQNKTLELLPEEYCLKYAPTDEIKAYFCATDNLKNAEICRGDTGSPLICDDKIIGIMSWTILDGAYPSYFTDVLYYRRWIYQVLAQFAFELRSAGAASGAGFLYMLLLPYSLLYI